MSKITVHYTINKLNRNRMSTLFDKCTDLFLTAEVGKQLVLYSLLWLYDHVHLLENMDE